MGGSSSSCCSDDSRVDFAEAPATLPRKEIGEASKQRPNAVASYQQIYNQPGGREIDELAHDQSDQERKKNLKLPLPQQAQNNNLGVLLDRQETPQNQTPIHNKLPPNRDGKTVKDIDDKFDFSDASAIAVDQHRIPAIDEQFEEISQVR